MSADEARAPVWEGRPVRSYHGQPVLKEPIWTWEIPTYFFTGGLTGASAGLAQLAELRGNEVLARRAWATAAAATAVSPILLISDLGRPARFLNMLRMFKVTSPMSVGSWILTLTGAANAVGTLHMVTGAFPRAGRVAHAAAAITGLPMATYTAALIANTAVPAWHEARWQLPFVFASGAALSAGAAAVITTPPKHAAPARRLALGAVPFEIAASIAMEHTLGEHGRWYTTGTAGKLAWVRRVWMFAGAEILRRRGQSSRLAAAGAGAALLAGTLAKRWQIFIAGAQSAANPASVIGPQRAGIERGERRGASRR